jgi:hypothetical protein
MITEEREDSEAVEAALFLLAILVLWPPSAVDAPVDLGLIVLNSMNGVD